MTSTDLSPTMALRASLSSSDAGSIAADRLREVACRPLFEPLAGAMHEIARMGATDVQALDAWRARCTWPPRTASGKPVRFVAPDADACGYEQRIHACGEVATRSGNWHDFFNALVWATFPNTKAALNALHIEESMSRPAHSPRGALRDAATQFDESGLIVMSADPTLFDLLRARRWVELFWARRAAVGRAMRFLVFGHGLYDALRAPFYGLCGRAALVEVDATMPDAPLADQIRHVDEVLSKRFAERFWYPRAKAFEPVPVLGIPGMTADNECLDYYQDERQFRPGTTVPGSSLARAWHG